MNMLLKSAALCTAFAATNAQALIIDFDDIAAGNYTDAIETQGFSVYSSVPYSSLTIHDVDGDGDNELVNTDSLANVTIEAADASLFRLDGFDFSNNTHFNTSLDFLIKATDEYGIEELINFSLNDKSLQNYASPVEGYYQSMSFHGVPFAMDNIDVSMQEVATVPVPEPGTLMLMTLGLAGLGATRLKSNQKQEPKAPSL